MWSNGKMDVLIKRIEELNNIVWYKHENSLVGFWDKFRIEIKHKYETQRLREYHGYSIEIFNNQRNIVLSYDVCFVGSDEYTKLEELFDKWEMAANKQIAEELRLFSGGKKYL